MNEYREVEVAVTGKVQMVFFRVFAKECADALGLVGFVRNEPDGSVHIIAQGEEEDLKQLIAQLYEGPQMAQVEDVQVSWRDPKERFQEFRIV